MKYTKPELHLISAVTAEAVCVFVGSGASSTGCTQGRDITVESCASGRGAYDACSTTGHAAASSCLSTGFTQGWDCVDGSGAS